MIMRNATLFISLLLLITLSACSDEEAVKPLISAERVDHDLALDLDLDLERDLNLDLSLPLDRLKFELATAIMPSYELMSDFSAVKLQEYDLTLDEFFPDPNDPRRGMVGLLVVELEELYAAGYEVQLLPPNELDPPVSSSGTKVGECLLIAVGVKGVVDVIRDGNTGKILTKTVLKGIVKSAAIKSALGWIGWGWAAWELGTCLKDTPHLADEDKPYDFERAKWDKKYRDKMMRYYHAKLVAQVKAFQEEHPDSFFMVLDTTLTN